MTPARRTCSECMHLRIVNRSPIDRCSVRGEFMWANTPACPSFNAQSGLMWEFYAGEDDDNLDWPYWELSKDGDSVGQLFTADGDHAWLAYLDDGAEIIWSGTLHACARALVERVKERMNG